MLRGKFYPSKDCTLLTEPVDTLSQREHGEFGWSVPVHDGETLQCHDVRELLAHLPANSDLAYVFPPTVNP